MTKPFDDEVLLCAIRSAVEPGGAALSHEVGIRTLRNLYASLTHRERQVMALLASGLFEQTGRWRLGISEITVKAHRGQVMRKMTAGSLADL